MAIAEGTTERYLNNAGEVIIKIRRPGEDGTAANNVYIRPDGTQAPSDGDYPIANDAYSFYLYEDGSLESYRHLGVDGSYVELKFAPPGPDASTLYGPNSEYTRGDLTYSETLAHETVSGIDVLVHKIQSYVDGQLAQYVFAYGQPNTSSVVLKGEHDATTGTSIVSLTNHALAAPITMTGLGSINGLNGLTASLIGNDGSTLIGNDGSTLVDKDGAPLIGNDGSTLDQSNVNALIGNDGSTLIGNDGSTLIGMDGGTLIGNDGSTYTLNTLAGFRGYSLYSAPEDFGGEADPPVDSVAADRSTTTALDLFGNYKGELETGGDRDWVKVELKAGETYAITVNGAHTGDGTLIDPYLRLHDAAGELVGANDDDHGAANARLTFTATTDGTYYVEAASSGDTGVGSYAIGVHRQPTAFVKDGATVDMGHGIFPSGTSIAALSDGSYAIGFSTRYYAQQQDGAWDDVGHANVAIVDATGAWVDLDSRADFSTYYIPRPGNGYAQQPGPTQVVAGEDGSYTAVVANTWSFPWSSSTKAQVAQGSVLGLGPNYDITLLDGTGPFGGIANNPSGAVDIARLANGQYIVSMGGGDSTPDSEGAYNQNLVQVSVNGRLPLTVADSGIHFYGQQTSVSALGTGAVVVWTDAAADPSGDQTAAQGVLGAILDADGNVLHRFDVNQTEARAQWVDSAHAVSELADGGFVVAWSGWEDVSLHAGYANPYFAEVFLRVFNADGTARTDEMRLTGSEKGISYDSPDPAVIGLPGGGFAVSWVGGNNPNGNIRLQQFDSDGNKIGAETGVGNGSGQSMTLSPDGKLTIAYLGDGLLRVQTMEPNKDPTDILLSSNTIAESPDYGPDGATPEGYYSYSNALIGTLSAVDANATDIFTYQLLDDAGGALRLEGTQLRWSSSTTHRPDYEAQSSYGIQVKVTDSAGRSFIKDLDIDVTDVNEAVTGYTAVYASGRDYASIEENTAPGALIATLSGIDPDVNETFTFALLNGEGLPFGFTGNQLRLTGPVDAEVRSYYDLTVRITDSAGHTVDRSLSVSVADIDDAAPTDIQLNDILWYNGALDEIEENTPAGTLIGYVNATDPDSYTYRGDFTFSLVGDSANRFELKTDENGPVGLYTKTVFDYEMPMHSVDVTLAVSDRGNRSFQKTFTLDVTDVNDKPVIVGGSTRIIEVDENSTGPIRIQATDQDGDELRYSAFGGADGWFLFDIDDEGNLSFLTPPNFEEPRDSNLDNNYEVEVSVYDGFEYARQSLTIKVMDVDEAPRIVTDSGLAIIGRNIPENQPFSASIGAVDPENKPLVWSLVAGDDSDLFTLSNTGVLSRAAGFDYENPIDQDGDGNYKVTVQVSDGVNTARQTWFIGVIDRLEEVPADQHAPVIGSNGGGATAAVSIAENTTTVTTVQATDVDAGTALTYTLAGGADAALFAIDATTGVLSFKNAPNFEAPGDAGGNNVYDVIVQASDGALTDMQALAVTVTDVDEGGDVSIDLSGFASNDAALIQARIDSLVAEGKFNVRAIDSPAISATLGDGFTAGFVWAGADEASLTGNDESRLLAAAPRRGGSATLTAGGSELMVAGQYGQVTFNINSNFHGWIAGLQAGDIIHVSDIQTNDVSLQGSNLVFGSPSLGGFQIGVSGDLAHVYFSVAYDGWNGLLVTLEGPPPAPGTEDDDMITGSSGSETLDGGAGNDTIVGGGGADTIDLGSGDDTLGGYWGDMNGDVVSGFASNDRIDITGSLIGRANFDVSLGEGTATLTAAGSSLQLNGDFTGGDFMVVTRGTGADAHTVVTFQNYLPSLGEGVSVDPAKINGVANEAFLTGDGTVHFTVDFKSSGSSYANTLGSYHVAADGTISDVQILFANTRDIRSGSVDLGVPANDERIGFFLIQDGYKNYGNLPDNLSFLAPGGSTAADLDDGLPPTLSSATLGALTAVPIFHSFATLNPGDANQVLSGVSPGGRELLIGFEDLPSTSGDNDFQDVVISVRVDTDNLLLLL